MGFSNKACEFRYFKTRLVSEAQIRDMGYATCGRYNGYVAERSGRRLRQPPFAAHPHIHGALGGQASSQEDVRIRSG